MAARGLPHNFQSTKMAFLSEGSSSGEASIPRGQPERQHQTTSIRMLTKVHNRCQSQEEAGEAISSISPSDTSETSGETVMMGNRRDPSTAAPVSFWRVRPSSEACPQEQQPAPHQLRAAMEIRMVQNLRDSTEKRIGTSVVNASSSAALSPPTRLLDDSSKPSRQRGKGEAQVGAFREAWRGPFGFPSALTQMSLRGYTGSEDEDDADRVHGWRGLLPSERRAKQEDDLDSTCTNTNTNTDLESSLTIAQEVDQSKEKQIQVQEATEYDPNKIPMSPLANKSRTVKLLLCLLLLGVATVAITLGVTVSKNQRNPYEHPSEPVDAPSDTSLSNDQKRWIAIDEELEGIFGAYSTSSSTFLQARDWLKHEDPMQLVPEDSNFVQRFTLALFYFQTSGEEGEDGWFSCGKARPELDETDTCGFYLLIHHVPVLGYEVIIHNRWLSSTHECIWAGVSCNASNQTSEIRLEGHNMTGTLPTELTKLSALESLSLGYNELHGTVSSDFADKLEHLVSFSVEGNLLSGPLPASLFSAGMRIVSLADNLFEGTLPSAEMADMSELAGLFVSWNLLTGTIPTEIGLLDSLQVLQISSNEFTGELPSEVGNLQQLEALLISRQGLDSTIPTEIGRLHKSLSSFQAKGTGLKGTIPDSVYELSKLRVLDLANNFLTGSISPEISMLTSLYRLGLDDNGFGGDIPDELGELGSDDSSNGFGVQYVSLHRNPMLTGPIPEGLCGIQHLWADCDKNACPDGCCTVCCGDISDDYQEGDTNEKEGLSVCEELR